MRLLIFFLLIPNVVFCTNYYVSTSAGGTNSGTLANPWLTLSKITQAGNSGVLHPGDSILLKRGDVFYCPAQFHGLQYWNGTGGGTCPSGTASQPIVFSCYGNVNDPLPNCLFPFPTAYSDTTSKVVLSFEGVDYIHVKNIQFNDTRRLPVNHVLGAYCSAAISFGEDDPAQKANHCKAENLYISGCGNGIIIVGKYDSVINCTIEHMGNVLATGQGSFGSNPLTITGLHHYIVGNYLADGWGFSDSFSPYFNGGAFEMFNTVDSCFIGYNTIVDCSGLVEWGALSGASTCKDNVFAYNKIINVGDISYVNVNGPFAIQPSELTFVNNVIIENDSSLFSGPNGNRLMTNFPTYPSGYSAVYRGFYNNGSPSASVVYRLANNLIANYNHFTIILTPSKTVHTYNGYKLSGGSSVGTSLSTGEANVSNMWRDTTSTFPQLWNFRLNNQIAGTTISGLSHDFYNVPISGTTSQGIAQYVPLNSIPIPFQLKVGSGTVTIGKVQ